MVQVTYLGKLRRTRQYLSEQRALQAIRNWLSKQNGNVSAILYQPQQAPITFTHLSQLPEPALKTTDFYRSKAWLALRANAFERFGNRCQCCGASPQHGAVLHVDHIKPRSHFPELALSINNLQILCAECNLGKSNRFETQSRD